MLVTKSAVLTENGIRLHTRNIAGTEIEFTRIEIGSGQYTQEEIDALKTRTSLKNKKQQFGISKMEVVDDETVVLTAMITNKELKESYTIREVGLYAREKGKPETECLCSISLAEIEDYFPAYSGGVESRILEKYYYTVSDSDTVHLSFAQDPVALAEDLEAAKKRILELEEQAKDLISKLEDALYRKDVVDNLLSTAANLPLSANQGKILNDAVTQLNTDIGNKIYIGKTVSPGKFPEKPTDWLISSFNINQVEYVGDGTIDSTYPQNTNGRSYHWNVLTFGHPIRCTQIAFQAYIGECTDAENAMFIRSEHDYITTDWKQV